MNDNRLYLNSKNTLINLLNMGMPIKLIAAYFAISEQTVNNYIKYIKEEAIWNGEVVSFINGIPRMLMILAVLIQHRTPFSWMRLEGLSVFELRTSISNLLQVEKIVEILNYNYKATSSLLSFGFSKDLPDAYQNFIKSFDNFHEFYGDGDLYWKHYLNQFTEENQQVVVDCKNWPKAVINELILKMINDIRPNIAPLFTPAVCTKVDELLATLSKVEESVLRMSFGISGPVMTNEEIGIKLEIETVRIKQIKAKALRRAAQSSRQQIILAFPLSWETVNDLLNKNIEQEKRTKIVRGSSEIHLIVDQDFSVRAINILKDAEINSLEDICKLTKSHLMRFHNMGKKTLDEIDEILKQYDLSFLNEY